MRIFFVPALILAVLVTIFAVQNNQSIPIDFLFWSIEGSLALVLMATLVLGIAIGALLMAPGSARNRIQIGRLQRSVRSMEEQRANAPSESPPEIVEPQVGPGESPEDK